ncbi:MAG TPA: hypothetical protein ENJ82_11450 [Bacteroidetes bacterium]|nr:hypothetical protein [Bacteroidota bacterium]
MKTNNYGRTLFLLILRCGIALSSHAQSQPSLAVSGNWICLNDGTNSHCENTDGQINVLSYSIDTGYELNSLPFPFPVQLSTDNQLAYLDVFDSPIQSLDLNGQYLHITFFNAGPVTYDLQEEDHLGIYLISGKTGIVKGCQSGHPLDGYLDADQCKSIAVYNDLQGDVLIQTGIGTVMVIAEISDTTNIPSIWGTPPAALYHLEDPLPVSSSSPPTIPGETVFELDCVAQHRALAINDCTVRVSPQSDLFICGNYVIAKDPMTNVTYSFFFNEIQRVYVYRDNQTNEIVIWTPGPCTF